MAAISGYHDMVRVLLDHKASVNIQDCHGNTPLHLAASNGNYEVVKLLVGEFADVDAVTKVLLYDCFYVHVVNTHTAGSHTKLSNASQR